MQDYEYMEHMQTWLRVPLIERPVFEILKVSALLFRSAVSPPPVPSLCAILSKKKERRLVRPSYLCAITAVHQRARTPTSPCTVSILISRCTISFVAVESSTLSCDQAFNGLHQNHRQNTRGKKSRFGKRRETDPAKRHLPHLPTDSS